VDIGAAWVFTRTADGWQQQGYKLIGSGAVGTASQGRSVALAADGSTAIIGGPGDNKGIGAAWVFRRIGGAWTQQGGKLVGTGGQPYSPYGVAEGASVGISADGNTLVLGGPYDNNNIGAVWAFTQSNGTWSQLGSKLVGSGYSQYGPTGGGLVSEGSSVALSGDGKTIVEGGPHDHGAGTDNEIGAAWVFVRP
jgi:hypothetical protein